MALFIFDFDGTLVELEDMQNSAYDNILPKFGIDFDMRQIPPGVPITEKMKLFKEMGYDFDEDELKLARDNWVVDNVERYLSYSPELKSAIKKLRQHSVLCIATNASRPYVEKALEILQIEQYISKINTIDEFEPKPCPDMFMDCILTYPYNTIIFEDSESGFKAASQVDAILEKVNGVQDTIDRITTRYDI